MNGVGLAVLSESQNAKVGASAVAAWRRRTSTTFEFNASGTVGGKPVNANLLVVVDILNGGMYVAVHAVVPAATIYRTVASLKTLGAEGILVTRIERLMP
jgi:hypothetical protein